MINISLYVVVTAPVKVKANISSFNNYDVLEKKFIRYIY